MSRTLKNSVQQPPENGSLKPPRLNRFLEEIVLLLHNMIGMLLYIRYNRLEKPVKRNPASKEYSSDAGFLFIRGLLSYLNYFEGLCCIGDFKEQGALFKMIYVNEVNSLVKITLH